MIVHYYINRRHERFPAWGSPRKPDEFRLLCTKKWEVAQSDRGYKTAFHRITCSDCLKILIPKKETELKKMKENLAASGDRSIEAKTEEVPALPSDGLQGETRAPMDL